MFHAQVSPTHKKVICILDIPMWTRGSCFKTLHVMLFTITFPGSGLMALVLAIDRLLAVYIPIRYLSFSRNYAFYLSSAGYSIVIPCFIASVMITYGSSDYANFPVGVFKKKFNYFTILDCWNM